MKSHKTELLSLVFALSLLTLLAVASSAYAGPGPKGAMAGPGFGMPFAALTADRMAERLELDETQRQTIRNIVEAAKPEFDALRQSARSNREALAALDPEAADYSAALNNAATENGRLATEATLLSARVRNEINAVLTEEQRAKLEGGRQQLRDAADRRGRRR